MLLLFLLRIQIIVDALLGVSYHGFVVMGQVEQFKEAIACVCADALTTKRSDRRR